MLLRRQSKTTVSLVFGLL